MLISSGEISLSEEFCLLFELYKLGKMSGLICDVFEQKCYATTVHSRYIVALSFLTLAFLGQLSFKFMK